MSDPTTTPPAVVETAPQPNTPPAPAKTDAATPVVPPAAPPKPESQSFLELKKQERAHRAAVEASKKASDSERAALDKDKAELAAKMAVLDEREKKLSRAKENPIEAIKALGLTEDEIAQAIISGQSPEQIVKTAQDKLKEELEADIETKVTAKLEAERAKEREARQAQILTDWQVEAKASLVSPEGAKAYPILNALNLTDSVIQEILNLHLNKDPILDTLTLEQAAANAEAYYKDLYKKAQAAIEPTPAGPATPVVKATDGESNEKLVIKEPEKRIKITERPVINNNMTPSVASSVSGNDAWETIKKQVLEKHGLK